MSRISKNIKQFRGENKMTQDALAEIINVTRQTVSSWETDRTQPDIEMIETLSGVFGVSIEELIYGKKNRVGLEPEKKPDRKIYTVVLTIFGTLLTVAGLVIVFIEFWDELSRAKNFFAVLPLLAGFSLAVFAVSKKPNSIPWREGSAVAWTAGVAITNALLNSLNSIDFGFFQLLLLDGILIIPVMFITKGIFPFAAYFYAISHSLLVMRTDGSASGMISHTLLLFALFAVGVFFYKKHKAGDVTDVIRFWVVFAAFGVDLISTVLSINDCSPFTDQLAILLFALFFIAAYAIGDKFSPRPLRQVSAVGICAVSYFILFTDTGYIQGPGAAFYVISGIFLLFALMCAVINRKNLLKDKTRLALLGLALAESVIFLTTMTSSIETVFMLIAIPIFLIGVTIIVKGVNEAKLLTTNFGMLNAAAIIIILFMTSDADILVKGFVILAAGIILLVINKLLIKKFAKEAEVQTDA